ncbi:hypothetical protein [Streptomyces sp. NPDC030920]|uniref:hypothetical protein n=1 Tax=Streptomyces sp. NPDC030920 TaxID=3365308 RepID=UPI0038501E6B
MIVEPGRAGVLRRQNSAGVPLKCGDGQDPSQTPLPQQRYRSPALGTTTSPETSRESSKARAFESGLFDRITLSTRSERVMESTRESGQYNPGSAEFGDRLQEVRTAAMAPEKARGHLKAYDDTMRGYIASNLVNPSTTPDLSRVTRDAMGVRSGLDLSLPERDAFAAGIYSYQVNIEFPDKIHKSLMPRDSH